MVFFFYTYYLVGGVKLKKIYKIIFCFLLLITLIGDDYSPSPLTIYFFDVGQADCSFLQLPNGENMLIDCGNTADGSRIVNQLSLLGVRQIDHLVITHPHEDHVGGADNVLNSFFIKNIYTPKIKKEDLRDTICFKEFASTVKRLGLLVQDISAGDLIMRDGFLKISCLSPYPQDYAELNEYSAVLEVVFYKNTILFMADAEKINENALLSEGSVPDCDIIKIGHHGSNSGTTKKFIKTAAPEYAIITVGADNPYGHPDGRVLRRLYAQGTAIYRTDLCGTIVAESDGRHIKIHTTDICLDGDIS